MSKSGTTRKKSRNDPPRDGPKRKRDPLPPVIKVSDLLAPIPQPVGLALVLKMGDPVTWESTPLGKLKRNLIEARAGIDAALRIIEAMEG